MNDSIKKGLLGLTLIAMGIAAGWGLAQWRAGTAHSTDATAAHVGAGATAGRKVLYLSLIHI